MKLEFKMDYLRKIYKRYHKSSRKEKKKILDEFCEICKYNRKYAIWRLSQPPPPPRGKKKLRKARKSSYTYNDRTISILTEIWKSLGYACSYRLKAALPLWLPRAKQRFRIDPEVEKQLLSISSPTIDRRLKHKKYRIKGRIYSTTRPGTLLKHQIPIKTDNWDVDTPGFMEVDLVAHCGNSAEGEFINSVNHTDIQTTWVETRATMGKGQAGVFAAIEEAKDSLPFELKGLDPDNDGAFINHHLKKYCDKERIQFTRSRPYKKDDNAHIEQKNFTHVRKIFGYCRYDTKQALHAMNDLYRNELCWFQNLFQPSVKLVKKIRIGSKTKRIYGPPKTPFQRVCECKNINSAKVAEYEKLLQRLDPFELSETIDKKLDRIYQMARRRITKTEKASKEKFTANFEENFARSYTRQYINL